MFISALKCSSVRLYGFRNENVLRIKVRNSESFLTNSDKILNLNGHVALNLQTLSISLLSRVYETSAHFDVNI